LLAAENERGQLLLDDLKAISRRQKYLLTSRIAYTYFAPDNRKIFVLTGDHSVDFLAVPKPPGKSKEVAAKRPSVARITLRHYVNSHREAVRAV
jgi:hypothetical protein